MSIPIAGASEMKPHDEHGALNDGCRTERSNIGLDSCQTGEKEVFVCGHPKGGHKHVS